MNEELKKVIESIKETMKPAMDKWEEGQVEMLLKLKEAIAKHRKEEGASAWKLFGHFQRMGFTRTAITLASYETEKGIRNIIAKEAAKKLYKIDVAVHKQLGSFVEHVVSVTPLINKVSGKDSYAEGFWSLEIADVPEKYISGGKYTFGFYTFFAGGHNIQCFHVRTKYIFKKEG